MRLANFVVVSDTPLKLDAGRWLDVLSRYKSTAKLSLIYRKSSSVAAWPR